MPSEIQNFSQINFWYVLGAIVVILAAFKLIEGLFSWAAGKLGLEFKWKREKKEDRELLLTTVERANKLEEKIEMVERNSYAADQRIEDNLNTLSSTVENINAKLDSMRLRSDETERARIKDRIAQSYRYYHDRGEWTSMDKEAFEDLITNYELHGGKNSFVHDVCQPESYTWKIVER